MERPLPQFTSRQFYDIAASIGFNEITTSSYDKLFDKLMELSNDRFLDLWSEIIKQFEIHQSDFVRTYALNRGNYNTWLHKKRTGLKFRVAVIDYYKQNIAPDKWPVDHLRPPTLETFVTSINSRITNSVHYILFVDGDQASGEIIKLQKFVGHICDWCIGLICHRKNRVPRFYKHLPPWIAAYPAATNIKNSADTTLTVIAGILHMMVPISISFIVLTNDCFGHTLAKTLSIFGRNVQHIDHMKESISLYLIAQNLENNFTGFTLIGDRFRKIYRQILDYTLVNNQDTRDEDGNPLSIRELFRRYANQMIDNSTDLDHLKTELADGFRSDSIDESIDI